MRLSLASVLVTTLLVGAGGCGPQAARSVSAPSTSATAGCPTTAGSWQGGADQAPPGTPAVVKLGPGLELTPNAMTLAAASKGTPMRVTGVVYSRTCRPLAGVSIRALQTNGDGEYGPVVGDQPGACCYLQGLVLTDGAGRYELDTVRPGHYKGAYPAPPAHIHISVIHPVDRARVLAVWKSTTEARESYDVELRLRRSDGAYRWFNSRGTPMRDADGTLHALFDIVLSEP